MGRRSKRVDDGSGQLTRTRGLDLGVNIAILLTLALVLLSPSGVIGSRASAALESWKTKRAIADVWPELTSEGGRLNAGIGRRSRSVVEFVDYECPVCRRVAEEVSRVSASQGVDIIVRHLPLDIHSKARQAALAAVCSEAHLDFRQAHMDLLVDETWFGESDWMDWAASMGIEDPKSFQSCLVDEATSRRVDNDTRLAALIGVTGTPTFVTQMGLFPGERGLEAAVASLSSRNAARDATPP